MKLRLMAAYAVLACSGVAQAQLAGTQVDGTFTVNGGTFNLFDGTNGLSGGYGNEFGPDNITIGGGTEFGYSATVALVTADFTDTQLLLGEEIGASGNFNPQQFTFTTDTPGAFTGLTLASSNFTGLSYGLSGDTITVDWAGGNVAAGQQFSAVFDIAGAVPEPSTWAMMLFGFAAIGTALRRKRRLAAAA